MHFRKYTVDIFVRKYGSITVPSYGSTSVHVWATRTYSMYESIWLQMYTYTTLYCAVRKKLRHICTCTRTCTVHVYACTFESTKVLSYFRRLDIIVHVRVQYMRLSSTNIFIKIHYNCTTWCSKNTLVVRVYVHVHIYPSGQNNNYYNAVHVLYVYSCTRTCTCTT